MFQSPGRVAFSLGGFEVMWYGVLIAIGIVCAFFVIYYRAPKYHGISTDRTFNLVIIILITALLGARVYYVVFEWDYYGAHPSEILNFRAGGLAIHGGLIFGCLMAALLARIYHEKFFNIVDLFFVGIPLGQAIGRWGNFFNSEAHGTHTDLPWAVIVNGDTVQPTFLYESIWCVILFFILWRVDNKRKFNGQIFFLYCMLYSVERYFVEGLRTDSLMVHFPWGVYRQAQVLSAVAFVAGLALYILFNHLEKKRQTPLAFGADGEPDAVAAIGGGHDGLPDPASSGEIDDAADSIAGDDSGHDGLPDPASGGEIDGAAADAFDAAVATDDEEPKQEATDEEVEK